MSAPTRYNALPPLGTSITANDSGSPTATPARRYPGGARSGVGVGTTAVDVAVGLGGGGGADAERCHSQSAEAATSTSNMTSNARGTSIGDHTSGDTPPPVAGASPAT